MMSRDKNNSSGSVKLSHKQLQGRQISNIPGEHDKEAALPLYPSVGTQNEAPLGRGDKFKWALGLILHAFSHERISRRNQKQQGVIEGENIKMGHVVILKGILRSKMA